MKRLTGKSALITGAARGIGRGFAEAYLAEGATVAIADIDLDAAKQTASELGGAAYAVQIDVSDQGSIDAAVAAVVSHAGKLDILINNAALFDAAETIDITRASYDKLYAVNVAGTLFTMQAAAKQMIAQGHGGKIINMASQAGRRGESLVLVYCSTKAAVISMTQSAGLNLIKHGINANAIAPGVVDGEHWEHVDAMFAKLEGMLTSSNAVFPTPKFSIPPAALRSTDRPVMQGFCTRFYVTHLSQGHLSKGWHLLRPFGRGCVPERAKMVATLKQMIRFRMTWGWLPKTRKTILKYGSHRRNSTATLARTRVSLKASHVGCG